MSRAGQNLDAACCCWWCCMLQGSKLTEVINARHENPKYLPGISLGTNVIADPDLESTVSLLNSSDCIVCEGVSGE